MPEALESARAAAQCSDEEWQKVVSDSTSCTILEKISSVIDAKNGRIESIQDALSEKENLLMLHGKNLVNNVN